MWSTTVEEHMNNLPWRKAFPTWGVDCKWNSHDDITSPRAAEGHAIRPVVFLYVKSWIFLQGE